MAEFNTLHNELRLRVPNKPYEFYDDAIRWAINKICVKTSLWKVTTDITTGDSDALYDIALPTDTVIHSNLYIVQEGDTNRVIKRPINGFKVYPSGESDYLQAFKTPSESEVLLFPTPKDGGESLTVHTAVKPTKSATSASNDKFFDEYSDIVVDGALHRCYELDSNLETSSYYADKFKKGYNSIHIDVLNENSDTPMKLHAGW